MPNLLNWSKCENGISKLNNQNTDWKTGIFDIVEQTYIVPHPVDDGNPEK